MTMSLSEMLERESDAEKSAAGVIAATSLNEALYGNTANRYISRLTKFKEENPLPHLLSELLPYQIKFEQAFKWEPLVIPGIRSYLQYQILKHKLEKGPFINGDLKEMFQRNEAKRELIANVYMAVNRTMMTLAKEGYTELPKEMIMELLELAGLADTMQNVTKLLKGAA